MFNHLSKDERGRYTPVPGLRGRNILEIVEAVTQQNQQAMAQPHSSTSNSAAGAAPRRTHPVDFEYDSTIDYDDQSCEFHGKASTEHLNALDCASKAIKNHYTAQQPLQQ